MKRIAFILLMTIYGCAKDCLPSIGNIDIYNMDGTLVTSVNDKNIICVFEDNVEKGKKLELFKNPGNYKYMLKSESGNVSKQFYIKGDTISTENGLLICKANFEDLLNIN